MSALNPIPDRNRLEAVLMQRDGLGWSVGVGRIVGGRIERKRTGHMMERDATTAALALSDRLDLMVVKS